MAPISAGVDNCHPRAAPDERAGRVLHTPLRL
jgi:hypothetical protein